MTDIVYSIKESKLKNSIVNGFKQDGDELLLSPGTDYHMVILAPLDGNEMETNWGRLKYSLDIPENFIYFTYVFGANTRIADDELKTISDFKSLDAERYVGQNDILLYSITGRFLYVGIEILGEGEGSISDIRIDKVGDNFMTTYPEIYQEYNSFFHRYLSIYSSIYNDFNEQINNLHKLLDVDHAPAKFLLEYGRWLGIDIDCDLKDVNVMRTFVKEAYELNKIKGTKAAVSRIAEILLGEEVTVLEKNIMEQYEDEKELESFKALFGENVYNVCILVNKTISESLKSQFMYMIKQFVPVRARVQIVSLKKEGELDFHSYLDMNAKLFESREGKLDNEMALDHAVTLME